MITKSYQERKKREDIRTLALSKFGVLEFVGTTNEVAEWIGTEPTIINRMIRNNELIFGYSWKQATKSDRELFRFMQENKQKEKNHIPKRYRDSHSVRFTPL